MVWWSVAAGTRVTRRPVVSSSSRMSAAWRSSDRCAANRAPNGSSPLRHSSRWRCDSDKVANTSLATWSATGAAPWASRRTAAAGSGARPTAWAASTSTAHQPWAKSTTARTTSGSGVRRCEATSVAASSSVIRSRSPRSTVRCPSSSGTSRVRGRSHRLMSSSRIESGAVRSSSSITRTLAAGSAWASSITISRGPACAPWIEVAPWEARSSATRSRRGVRAASACTQMRVLPVVAAGSQPPGDAQRLAGPDRAGDQGDPHAGGLVEALPQPRTRHEVAWRDGHGAAVVRRDPRRGRLLATGVVAVAGRHRCGGATVLHPYLLRQLAQAPVLVELSVRHSEGPRSDGTGRTTGSRSGRPEGTSVPLQMGSGRPAVVPTGTRGTGRRRSSPGRAQAFCTGDHSAAHPDRVGHPIRATRPAYQRSPRSWLHKAQMTSTLTPMRTSAHSG